MTKMCKIKIGWVKEKDKQMKMSQAERGAPKQREYGPIKYCPSEYGPSSEAGGNAQFYCK